MGNYTSSSYSSNNESYHGPGPGSEYDIGEQVLPLLVVHVVVARRYGVQPGHIFKDTPYRFIKQTS